MKYELERKSDDFQRIQGLLSAQLNGIVINKIEVIQNIIVWEKFQTEIKFIKDKYNYDRVIPKECWFGTKSIDPYQIYYYEGFDMKYN